MRIAFYPLSREKSILLLTLLALLLRFFQLGEWSFWHDEALTVLLAQKPLVDLITITAADVHPPLYYLLVKGFLALGQNEFVARVPSALGGTGTVLAAYLVGRDLFDEAVGLLAGLVMTIAPLQLFYAQEARMYTLLLLLTILSSWWFIRAVRNNRWVWWALFALGITLASYTAYFTFFVVTAMGLYLVLVDRRRERVGRFLVAIGVAALLYLPWVRLFLSQTRAVLDTYWMARPHPLELFTTITGFFIGVTLPPVWIAVSLAVTLSLVFIVFSNVSHALRAGQDVRSLVWLLLWGLVPLLGTFLVSLIRPIFQLRTVLTAAPAFYLLVAWGIMRAKNRRLNLVIFLGLVVLMGLATFNFYFNPAFAKPDWRRAARYVHERVQPGDVVIHTGPGSYFTFLAYPHHVPHLMLPGDPALVRENAPSQAIELAVGGAPQSMAEAVRGYRRAWLVVGLDQAVEHQLAQQAGFEARYHLLQKERVGNILVLTYLLDE